MFKLPTISTFILAAVIPFLGAADLKTGDAILEALSLDQALSIAESRHPNLAAASAALAAAEGRAQQASAFPNPELIAGAQQLPVRSRGPADREYLAGIGQQIPLGRRLSKARQAEELEREVHLRSLEATRRKLRKMVQGAFATALYQETAFATQRQIAQSWEKAVGTTAARLEAGDALREDLARVEMELARAKIELSRSELMRKQALLDLAAAMGDVNLKIESLAGTLESTFEISTLEALAGALSAQPEVLLADADVRARNARVDLVKAEKIPDVKVELLYHRLDATGADTVDVGFSIALPLFDRNAGRLREARADAAAAEARASAARNDAAHHLLEAHQQFAGALSSSRAIREELLSRAEFVLKSAEARYAAGDIALTEVLPVRRDSGALKLAYLESLREVMQAWAQLRAYEPRLPK